MVKDEKLGRRWNMIQAVTQGEKFCLHQEWVARQCKILAGSEQHVMNTFVFLKTTLVALGGLD